jgi:hypothetical protein
MERHSSTTCTLNTVEKEQIKQDNKPQAKISFKDLKIKPNKKVTWTEDTVDNEHMGKKKSKSRICLLKIVCCIFKKPILNPDDPDSSSCDSCDEKGKNAYERPNHYDRKAKC